MSRRDLTVERLREVLYYAPGTGHFTHKRRPEPIGDVGAKIFNVRYAGKHAGGPDAYGYIQICIDYRRYKAHRLAWLWVHGSIPAGMEVDHRDGNPANNAISNLRLATRQQQVSNTGPRKPGHPKGCHWDKREKKWCARFRLDGRNISLGAFERLEDARAARARAETKYHGEFAYTERPVAEPERRAA
jgi:hypothetical protein